MSEAFAAWRRITPPFALVLGLSGCGLEIVDLRRDEGVTVDPVDCPEGERQNPDSGRCEPCLIDAADPESVCLCAYSYRAAPFPYCEGDAVTFDCLPCEGGIDACNAYDAQSGTVTFCSRLTACCVELASTDAPCCAAPEEVYCREDTTSGALIADCCTCGGYCEGDADCEPWQHCDTTSNACTPACELDTETCWVSLGCVCQPWTP